MSSEKTYSGLRFWVLFLAGLSFVDLSIMLVVVTLHAAWPDYVQIPILDWIIYALSGVAVASAVAALCVYRFGRASHRTALTAIISATTGVLFADLAAIALHAFFPHAIAVTEVPVAALTPMTYILGGASAASIILGLGWFLLRYPQHRTVLLLVVLLTTGVLIAHLYTINSPPAYTPYNLSGSIGGTVHDPRVTVTTVVAGPSVAVTVSDTGGDAISHVAVSWGGTELPTSGFALEPSVTQPLLPGNEISGNWTLQSTPTGGVTVSYVDLSCYDVSKQVQGCVMDEIYYIPAAQTLLSGEKCGPYADNCNLEHPFLSKAFIAAGISLFGNNDFGWRIFDALLGTMSIPVVFGICWSITKDPRLSVFAAYLIGFETLFFIQSSIAVIDIQMIFFSLLAFLVYLANIRVWRLDRITLSAILLGISALNKETAVFLVAFLVVYNLLFGTGDGRTRFLSSLRMLIIVIVVFAAGLQLYVTLFGNPQTTTFVADIQYILKYGGSLRCLPTSCGWGFYGNGQAPWITPFSWMTYYPAVGYFVSRELVNNVPKYVLLGYWGVTDFFEIWLTWIWVPYVGYLAYKLWTSRAAIVQDVTTALNIDTPSFRLASFALLWYLIAYLPYIGLYVYGRVTYPYYMLPVMPAIAIGCAFLLTRKWFPREVAYVLLGGVFLWFFLYYPDKNFLPTWLRIILGH